MLSAENFTQSVKRYSSNLNKSIFTTCLCLWKLLYAVWVANRIDYHITKTYLYNLDPLKPHFFI